MLESQEIQVKPIHGAILRIVVGVFFFAQGMGKIGWLSSSERLLNSLNRYVENTASFLNRWYLEGVAIPYVDLWSRLIMLGELAIGLSLIFGVLTRYSLPMAILLVINFHFTNGTLFQWGFFRSPYAWLLLGCLGLLFFVKAGREYSLGARVSRENVKLW